MKQRKGFVSNSSSSSFVIPSCDDNIDFKDVFSVAIYMIGCRDGWEEKDNNKLIKKLEKALADGIITKDTNLMFRTCNYDTYIVKDYNYDKIYISTCNNHDFNHLERFYDENTQGELADAKRDNSRFYFIEEGIFATYLPYDNTINNRRCKKGITGNTPNGGECYGEIFKADDRNNYCIECELDKFKIKVGKENKDFYLLQNNLLEKKVNELEKVIDKINKILNESGFKK